MYVTIIVAIFIAFFGGYMACLGTGLAAEELVSRPLLFGGIFITLAAGHILGYLYQKETNQIKPKQSNKQVIDLD